MKTFYRFLIGFFCFIPGINIAQTTLSQAVDFTVTDVTGNTHNLFSILNSGQHVCIDFFFTTCGPCQATSPYFKQTFNNFGCNSEDIFFIAIDVGDNNAQVIAYENTFLGGAPGYPSVSGTDGGGNAVISAYGIGAFPTYILIKPDHSIIEQDMWPISNAATFTNYFSAHALTPIPCSTVGIEELHPDVPISIYPNPVTTTLHFSTGTLINSANVYNLLGEKVISFVSDNLKSGLDKLDVEKLPSGIYVLELSDASHKTYSRFTKN